MLDYFQFLKIHFLKEKRQLHLHRILNEISVLVSQTKYGKYKINKINLILQNMMNIILSWDLDIDIDNIQQEIFEI